MFKYLSGKRLWYAFFLLFLLVTMVGLSSCSMPFLSFSPGSSKSPTSLPLSISLNVPVCHLASCVNFAPVKGVPPFVDSGNNIHSMLSFDFNIAQPGNVANDYDFVWGTGIYHYPLYRAVRPALLLSYYIPVQRDNGIFGNEEQHRDLPYWQQVHPDWILYQCDRKTPALEYGDPNIPFNITNPAFFNWQVETYVKPASEFGYNALAVDNVNMENLFGACGYYDKPGHWVQRYTGNLSDPQWLADIASWVVHMAEVVHTLPHPLLLIPNFSTGVVTTSAPAAQEVVAHADAILDEGSFTHYGDRRVADKEWLNLVSFINSVQEQNKAFFTVNQHKQPLDSDGLQWIQGSYLMCNQHLEYLGIASARGYGHEMTPRERIVPIGHALGDMYQRQAVYWRDFSNGKVIVNPSSTRAVDIALPRGSAYVDVVGKPVSLTLHLPPTTARILLKKA